MMIYTDQGYGLQWIMINIFVILLAYTTRTVKSHSPTENPYSVLLGPFTKDGQFSLLFISLVIMIAVSLIALIMACVYFRFDRWLAGAYGRARASLKSYDRICGDTPTAKHSTSFDLSTERKNFSSGKPKTSITDSLKKKADVLVDRLQWVEQRKYSSPPTYGHVIQTSNDTRRDSDTFYRSFKENVERSNSFRAGGEGVKMSEELMRQYRERKLLARRKFSAGNDIGQRKFTSIRKLSNDNEVVQRKLSTMRKVAALTNDASKSNALMRRVPGCGSDGDLCRWPATYTGRPNRQRVRKLAGHNTFLTYDYEERFNSPWEARATLLDPRKTDVLVTMSECELDSYCIYFNVEEWQQIKCRWKLARNCRTIDEEQSDTETPPDENQSDERRQRSNTLGSVRRPSFRSMLKTVPYGADSGSRNASIHTRNNSEEEAKKEEEEENGDSDSLEVNPSEGVGYYTPQSISSLPVTTSGSTEEEDDTKTKFNK